MPMTAAQRAINKHASGVYSATLMKVVLDENGNPVLDGAGLPTFAPMTADDVDTMHLTLIDLISGGILNARDAQCVLNKNGVTFVDGIVTWQMAPADNPIVGDVAAGGKERHVATFTWSGPGGIGSHEVQIDVIQIAAAP